MANILNLVPKKEIFEGLLNKTINEIPIEKSAWWKKRLVDQDTGRFKPFDIVKASCGTSDKYDFPIVKIEDRKTKYVVIVSFNEDKQVEQVDAIQEEPIDMIENPVETIIEKSPEKSIDEIQEEINKKFLSELKVIEKLPYISPETTILETSNKNEVTDDNDWKTKLHTFFKDFMSYENVYVVMTPSVQIRSDGRIVSTNCRIKIHRDYDINFPFEKKEFIRYSNVSGEDFYNDLSKYLSNLINGNYIFIKSGSIKHIKRNNGDDVFNIEMAVKRSFMFR